MVDQKRYNIHNISKKEKFFGNSLLYIASYQIFLLLCYSILYNILRLYRRKTININTYRTTI